MPMDRGYSQEIITWTLTRPYFRYARKIILGLFFLLGLLILGALARRDPKKPPLHLFLKILKFLVTSK